MTTNAFHDRLRALMPRDPDRPRNDAPAVRQEGSTAIIRLYDSIDSWGEWWGLSASEFASVLDNLPDGTDEIRLLINSPGGEVDDAVAMMNQLRAHPARTVAVIEGIAASAASFIAAGCDELEMAPSSTLMIHLPWMGCYGNSDDMRKAAEMLDMYELKIANIYATKANGTAEEWRDLMSVETWFSAEEAVAAGLADRISAADSNDGEVPPTNRWDLSIFNFAGRSSAPDPKIPSGQPSDGQKQPPQGGPAVTFSDEQLTNLRQMLDVADDADEDQILAAVEEVIDAATAPDPEGDDPAPAALPEGVVPVDAAQLEQLRADAQAGREARAEQLAASRRALVAAAVADGRIPPARAEHWTEQLAADPGAEATLANLRPGLVPVDQIGNGGSADLDVEDADYAAIYGKEVAS